MMTQAAKVLRNSLIFLTLAAATASLATAAEVPLGSSANAPAPAPTLNVPMGSASTPPAPRLLMLKAPDIHDVMTPAEIEAAIPPDEEEVLGPETVAVHGEVPAPYVPMGFAALYWAAYHPMDSWRILAPVQ